MVGLVIQLIVSWLLLRWVEGTDLSALGFRPDRRRVIDFCFGLVAAAMACSLYWLAVSSSAGGRWMVNPRYTSVEFVNASWWTLKSVLFEELIFRGALLYILIRRSGRTWALVISSVSFGVYHWFTFGALSDPAQMSVIFVMTALWGWMYAFSFAETKSLYLPIALHLGYNFFNIVVFSQGPLGEQLLLNPGSGKAEGLLSLVLFTFNLLLLPTAVYAYLKWKSGTKA